MTNHATHSYTAAKWWEENAHKFGQADYDYSRYLEVVEAAWAAAITQPAGPSVPVIPDGYVLVPIKPTQQMLDALNSYAQCEGYIEEGYAVMLNAVTSPLATPSPIEGEKHG